MENITWNKLPPNEKILKAYINEEMRKINMQEIVETFSLVVWSNICNACCSFCVAKLTPSNGVFSRSIPIDTRKFDIAARLASVKWVDTAILTWRWEPLLYPDQITEYLKLLQKYNFPFITLQTRGES